jgi:signal transduction histidine kinase
LNAAILVNLIGFSIGIALYAMLGAMVLRHSRSNGERRIDLLLMTTAALGVAWNAGELYAYVINDLTGETASRFIVAAAYSALGFLPSVVVHSAQREETGTQWLKMAAYALSTVAAVLNLASAVNGESIPSILAMQLQAGGVAILIGALLIFNLRNPIRKRAVLAAALAIFALSALHLGVGAEGKYWQIELAAHQSSLPLVLVILYQNYRFAFADLFLKRALSLILLAAIALALYVFVAVPLLRFHETHDRDDMLAAALILGLWIATALVYPAIHKFAVWLVDRIVLERADYRSLQLSVNSTLVRSESVNDALEEVTALLASAITADRFYWEEATIATSYEDLVSKEKELVELLIPTAEAPQFKIVFSDFVGGRRLLSDEIAMLEAVSIATARRIDAMRVTNERYETDLQAETVEKLAAEAQLTALPAQINPHFLFNALTTIGYLIRSSPDKAYDTLMRLTQLLRGVLQSTGAMTTLGDEIELVKSYLDIERARFEERLAVEFDVGTQHHNQRIPPLLIQPLVENAIKHGISNNKAGGTIRISVTRSDADDGKLIISVWDSGAGGKAVRNASADGIGLANIRERLALQYGDKASVSVTAIADGGTLASVELPFNRHAN